MKRSKAEASAEKAFRAKAKPKKVRDIPLTAVAEESVVVIRKLPATITAKAEPAYFLWETPDGFVTTRKVNNTLIISEAPNGTHEITLEVLPKGTGALPLPGKGTIMIVVDVKAE